MSSFLQWLLCYFGLHDSANIDVELEHHQSSLLTPQPVLNNVLLLLIFLSLHRSDDEVLQLAHNSLWMHFFSLLARSWLKRALSPIVSPSLYRQLYFLISAATLFLVPYGWSPLPRLLWHIDTPVIKYLVYGEYICTLRLNNYLDAYILWVCMYMCTCIKMCMGASSITQYVIDNHA